MALGFRLLHVRLCSWEESGSVEGAGTSEPERPAFRAQLNDLCKLFNLSQIQFLHVPYGDNSADFTKPCVWHIEGTQYMAAPVLSVNNYQARS